MQYKVAMKSYAARKRTRTRRLLELALETAFAISLVIGIAAYAIYGPEKSIMDGKWIAFAGTRYSFLVVH